MGQVPVIQLIGAQTSDLAHESGEIVTIYLETGKMEKATALVAYVVFGLLGLWWLARVLGAFGGMILMFVNSPLPLVGSDTRRDSTHRGICPFVPGKASQEKPKPEVRTPMHRTPSKVSSSGTVAPLD